MWIDLSVTIKTQRRRPLKGIIDVASDASNIDMFSGQLKLENVMVKGCGQPTCHGMAQVTSRAKLPFMFIILPMA